MPINLTEYNLSLLTENTNYDNMLCQWNGFFDGLAIFIFLLAILVIFAGALKIRNENSIPLCFFISSGVCTLIGLFLFFVKVDGCDYRLLSFPRLAIFIVIFLASGVLLFFDKDNQ